MFGVTSLNPANFELFSDEVLRLAELGFLGLRILEELGFQETAVPVVPNDLEIVSARFEGRFPTTKVMSQFAREQSGRVDMSAPDSVLTQWLQREEQLFRALERSIVEDQVKRGFDTVDEFLVFSLSVQNRRKSRMGYSLQNQLAALFDASEIRYEPQGRTEGKNRPDFLFPGSREYQDQRFEAALLVMLGAKSTLKERWRQILTEAERIPTKHLCTLEPGISVDQTEEIKLRSVRLVIPQSLHATYLEQQRRDIWTVQSFIDFVRQKQVSIS